LIVQNSKVVDVFVNPTVDWNQGVIDVNAYARLSCSTVIEAFLNGAETYRPRSTDGIFVN
jgi:hypothetical protein